MRNLPTALVALFVAFGATLGTQVGRSAAPAFGFYSAEQASRGKGVFLKYCSSWSHG